MKNGDRITGTVITNNGKTLEFKTSYAGTLAVDLAEVAKLETSLHGNPATAATSPPTDATTTSLGKQVVDPSDKEVVPLTDVEGSEPATTDAFTGHINLALKIENGNTDKDELDFDFRLEYRFGRNRIEGMGQLEYDDNDGINTKRDWLVIAKYNRYFTDKTYLSGWYGIEQEKFKGLDLRQFYGPAIGHEFSVGKPRTLIAELAVFMVDEDFANLPDNLFIGPGIFLVFEQEIIKDALTFYHKNYAIVDGGNIDKQLWHSWSGFRFPLFAGLIGSAEYEIDYDSKPALNAETTDTTFRLKIGYHW